MGKAVVILIIFLLLAGVLGFIYFKYEKPIKEQTNGIYYTNLTIFAENPQGENIKTTYIVYLNENVYDGGFTDKYGGVKQRVTTNSTYYIRNENLPDQKYYTSEMKFFSSTPDKSNRITLKLEEWGEMRIEQKGIFVTDRDIRLTLSENKSFNGLMYCLKWSERLIFVNANGDKMNDPVDGNYKCYETNRNVNIKNNYTVMIDYEMITDLSPEDYIKLTFYDKDELGRIQNYTKRQEYYLI